MTGVEITRVEKGTKFIILYEAMISWLPLDVEMTMNSKLK